MSPCSTHIIRFIKFVKITGEIDSIAKIAKFQAFNKLLIGELNSLTIGLLNFINEQKIRVKKVVTLFLYFIIDSMVLYCHVD